MGFLLNLHICSPNIIVSLHGAKPLSSSATLADPMASDAWSSEEGDYQERMRCQH